MFHKAIKLQFQSNTNLLVTFQDGQVKQFDMMTLESKYKQIGNLRDRKLFLSGKLVSPYGIIWNDEIDIETETIYEMGKTVDVIEMPYLIKLGNEINMARNKRKMSQKQLAEKTGISQANISRIECGKFNLSISMLERIVKALEMELSISIIEEE